MTKKRITKTEFTGLPIPPDDETAIAALDAQRHQIERSMQRVMDAIGSIAARLAKEAGWNVPVSELRIERGADGGMVLSRKPAPPSDSESKAIG